LHIVKKLKESSTLFQKQAAYEKYEIAILELQHDEKQAEKKAEEDLTKKKENDRHMVNTV